MHYIVLIASNIAMCASNFSKREAIVLSVLTTKTKTRTNRQEETLGCVGYTYYLNCGEYEFAYIQTHQIVHIMYSSLYISYDSIRL